MRSSLLLVIAHPVLRLWGPRSHHNQGKSTQVTITMFHPNAAFEMRKVFFLPKIRIPPSPIPFTAP